MLSIEDFIITVFCVVDDHLRALIAANRVRQCGFAPQLSDSEVITMETVGEFLGLDTDKGIWEYFGRHWRHFFPALPSRPTFVRQAANLWNWKQRLQRRLAQCMGALTDAIHLVDGFPIPVCRFARAHFSRIFKGQAAYGRCEAKKETFYGFHGLLLISLDGIVTAFTYTPGSKIDERTALWDLIEGVQGLLIGDKGFISAPLHEELREYGIDLQTALRDNMQEDRPLAWVNRLKTARRRIETVIGQLSERLHIEKVRARDMWHLTSRLARKLLAHTLAVFINLLHGREPLQFDGLVTP